MDSDQVTAAEATRAQKVGYVIIGVLFPLIGFIIALVCHLKYKKNGSLANKIISKYSLVSSSACVGAYLLVCAISAGIATSKQPQSTAKASTSVSKTVSIPVKPKRTPPKTVNSLVKEILSSDSSFAEFSIKSVDNDRKNNSIFVTLENKQESSSDLIVLDTGMIHTQFCEKLFKQFQKVKEITTTVNISCIDNYGNTKMLPVIEITWNREINNRINYTNFKDMSPYQSYVIARCYAINDIVWKDFKDKSDLNNKNVREY